MQRLREDKKSYGVHEYRYDLEWCSTKKKVKASPIEIPKESYPSSKETRVSQVEASNNRPSKKKKHDHREGPNKILRAKEPSSNKGREDENVLKTLHPRIEDDYNML